MHGCRTEPQAAKLCLLKHDLSSRVSATPKIRKSAKARALAAGQLNWDELRRIADFHGVIPMLWRFVSRNEDSVPESFLEALRADFFGNALRTLTLTRELVRIACAFDRAGIRLIALKGPALAIDAYGDTAKRQFVDLDLLVHRADLPRAAEILVAEGYSPRAFEPQSRGAEFFLSYEDQFISNANRGPVDIHWRLAPDYFPFAPDEDSIWRVAQNIEIQGTTIRTLATADHLLFVIVHATKHGWPTLGQVCDVAAIVRSHPELDWRAVAVQARRYRCERMLMLGLKLASDLIRARIGGELLARSECDSQVGALAQSIEARMFAQTGEPSALFHEFIVPFRSIESIPDRVRYLMGLALKPTVVDWEFMRLPRHFYWIYYADPATAAADSIRVERPAPSQAGSGPMNRAPPRFFRELVGSARWRFVSSLALILAFSTTEGFGILLLLPTLQAAGLDLAGQGAAGRYALADRWRVCRRGYQALAWHSVSDLRPPNWTADRSWQPAKRRDFFGRAGVHLFASPPSVSRDRKRELALHLPQPGFGFHPCAHQRTRPRWSGSLRVDGHRERHCVNCLVLRYCAAAFSVDDAPGAGVRSGARYHATRAHSRDCRCRTRAIEYWRRTLRRDHANICKALRR